MNPSEAVTKIEQELAQTCGAMSTLIVNNIAKKVGVERTSLSSKDDYQKFVDALTEPATKFLGKTKAEECIRRWKGMV